MRIERIRSKNIIGLGDIDWIFPEGPLLLLFKDKDQQKFFRELLSTLFYNQRKSLLPRIEQNNNKLVEVWIAGESLHLHICHEFIHKGDEVEQISTLVDEAGQKISLPEAMTLGEYLFKVQLQNFLLGGVVEWPKSDQYELLLLRTLNLRQGGEEELSLKKVRAIIAGAQKKVREQKETMLLVKNEYDALRREWEIVQRQQDNDRLLEIEIRKLQENEVLLTERITLNANIQERLDLLSQNSDYRELRQLQDELNQLEERLQGLEVNLTAISLGSYIDWSVIEGLREECLEWAYLQKNVDRLVTEAQARAKHVVETKNFLQTSGYMGLSEDADQILRRAVEERDLAQKKLNKLIIQKRQLKKIELIYSQEITRFKKFSVMCDVTEADQIRIAQKEKRLELWRSSEIGSTLDRMLKKGLGVKSIDETLSSRLLQYYKQYHVSNYREFKNQLKGFVDQRERVGRVKRLMERLQAKVSQEERLHRVLNSNNQILKQAFTVAQATNLSDWLYGWEDYGRKKSQLSLILNKSHLELEQQVREEKKLAECTEQLRNKLGSWGIPVTDREEVFRAILNVATQLREKEEVTRELAELSERFNDLLGVRDLKQLAKTLEPLAELERETRLPYEERQAETSAWHKEQMIIRQQLAAAKQRLQSNHKVTSLAVLEKKIETVKSQWMAYEDLRHALDDAQALLELSWQEWQTKYEKILNEEKQWIFELSFSSTSKSIDDETVAKREYFSYRMAIAQLALRHYTEVPLLMSVGKVKQDDNDFWGEVTEYLHKLSSARQVIFSTTDPYLGEQLTGRGWSLLALPH